MHRQILLMIAVNIMLLMAGINLGYQIAHLDTITAYNRYEVQQTCDRSRTVIDGKLEQDCGDIQTLYNMEYLCNSLKHDAVCWVEVK